MALPRALWRRHLPLGLLALFAVVVLAGCAGDYPQSTLDPKGDFAELVDAVFMKTVWWATAIFILVEAALLYAIFKFRGKPNDPEPKQVHGSTIVEIIWTVIPAAVLAFVAVPTVQTIFKTAEIPASSPDGQKPLTVEVIGHQWWWEFRYPELGIITANELRVPVGRTVDIRMKTVDVLHSFWIPQLAGKRDLFPNRETRLWFTAKEAGEYPGACAEFCGLQHGKMLFYVMADAPADFDAWVARRMQDSVTVVPIAAAIPTDTVGPAADASAILDTLTVSPMAQAAMDPRVAEGEKLFLTKACAGCHSLKAVGGPPVMVGPNLGGIGARRMIAAGWMRNTDENLKHWLQNPQEVKEGVLMQGYTLTDAEAEALVAYLRTKQ
jgi:cytochrome c oxidase subunit 2